MLGTIAIGRNEGGRLCACLNSLRRIGGSVVYVDSGSTDGSLEFAESLGVTVVALDAGTPFSASRARRAGFQRLLADAPDTEFVFFVDGDCEVVDTWPATGLRFLQENSRVAAVAGRRHERFPRHSWFNLECDWEWDQPAGATAAIGGDAIYRVDAYRAAGGFDASVAAGEEPELCLRLRSQGWVIWRLANEMTIHDAALTHWQQWWKRQVRTGYGGFDVERRFHLRLFDRLLRGAAFWSFAYPALVVVAALSAAASAGVTAAVLTFLLGLLGWCLQVLRIGLREQRPGWQRLDSIKIAWLMMLAKFPIAWGATKACVNSVFGIKNQLFEYKAPL